MAQGWWFEVSAEPADRRAVHWLVGIDDGDRAAARLAEELGVADRILHRREASAAELDRYGVGPAHLRQVQARVVTQR